MKFLRNLLKHMPSLLTASVFAIAVWIFAVNQADPTQTRTYPYTLEMETIGLDPSLMIVNDVAQQVSMSIRAPSSILDQLENETNLINVSLDLSGLNAGVHTLTPQVNLGLSPAEVILVNPSTVFVKLETVVTETYPVQLKLIGNPAIGFEVLNPELSDKKTTVTGPESLIETIDHVVGQVSIVDVSGDIQRTIDLKAINAEGFAIEGIMLNPNSIQVTIPVTQRGGYRTVVVKIVTSGQIAAGYRLTNIFSMPPTVTIYSSDPELVESVPGFVETTPINLNGANENMDIQVTLNLPEGINAVDSQNVTVQIGIEPIQSSISFNNIPVQTEGLLEDLEAFISPESVDVFLSGPLSLLEELNPATLSVVIDLTDRGPGTYQLAPEIILDNEAVSVDAILPNTLEVTIEVLDPNRTPRPTPTTAPTSTPTTTP
ncbi:MAG: CdaR family protein [Chloroflexota bacterium]|nr:CdaR family protein [Chloroflexota bacterium]